MTIKQVRKYIEESIRSRKVRSMELSPEVRRFAEAMERKLQQNNGDRNYMNCSVYYLLARMVEESGEFSSCLIKGGHPEWAYLRQELLYEAADVANFMMMICEKMGVFEDGS